jgi:hypothetical protein
MIIIAATTRFEYRKGALTIFKEIASPDLVKQAMVMIGHAASSGL